MNPDTPRPGGLPLNPLLVSSVRRGVRSRTTPRDLWALLALVPLLVASPAAAQEPGEEGAEAPGWFEKPAEDGAQQPAANGEAPAGSAPGGNPATVQGGAQATGTQETGVQVTAAREAGAPDELEHGEAGVAQKRWDIGFSGYFRAPMTLGISRRPGPDDLTGEPQTQISYGPNRTVDSNYYSFAYTRLQERDWMEVYVHARRKHVEATIGWMGYWFAGAGFRNPDAAWLPGIAYLTLDTDFKAGAVEPNVALSAGAFWPNFGRFDKYDTFTLGQYRHLGEQLKLTIPFTKDFTTTVVQGFGTGRDGSFNIVAPPPYQERVGLNLIEYAHLQFNYKESVEIGLHHNMQWTRDPNLLLQTSAGKSYTNAREAQLVTWGGEAKLAAPYFGSVWVSPSYVVIKNGWALGEAGVEVVHGLSPEGLAVNYLGWSGSPADSTGSGTLFNLGFLYENKLSTLMGETTSTAPEVTFNAFGLLVDASLDRPEGSAISQNKITQFKWGADVEYNPVNWLGLTARWDEVNYDLNNPGYIFSAITGRLSFYSDFLSGERIFLQYSRYRYGDRMTLAGAWPWGVPLIAGSDIIQGGPYAGSKPDMDVVTVQADVKF